MNNDNSIINIEYTVNEISSRANIFIKEHNTEEILETISECEICLKNNEVIISSLNERGFKHLINVLLGRDRRNNIKYRINVQTIQRLLIKLNRAFLQRLINDENTLKEYISRENQRDLLVLKQLNLIKKQLNDASYRVRINEWMQTIANTRNDEGILYRDLHIEEQAFLIIADYCRLCNYDDQNDLEKRILTVIERLGLNNQAVDIYEFYKVALKNRNKIYVNDFNKYSDRINDNFLSELGECLYSFPSFEKKVNSYFKHTYDNYNDKIVNKYIDYIKQKFEKNSINSKINIDELLCEYVIDDVLFVKNEIRRIKNEDALEAERIRKIEESEKQKTLEKLISLLEYRKNAYIIKINPEGVYKIGPSYAETLISIELRNNKDHNYTFELSEFIRIHSPSWTPELVIMENNYHSKKTKDFFFECIRNIKKFPMVSMSDYYMTLFTLFKEDIGLKYNNVILAELYDNKIHFHGYLINTSSGNRRFNIIFKNDTYGTLQFPMTIYNGLSEKTIIEGSIIYRTFTYPDRPINTLNNKRFNTQYIDQHLEKNFIEFPNTFWNVLEKLKMYVIHYDNMFYEERL